MISARIQSHIRNKSGRGKSMTAHYKLWRQKGIEIFRVLLGTLERKPFEASDRAPMLLNIFELYSTLLLRTVGRGFFARIYAKRVHY